MTMMMIIIMIMIIIIIMIVIAMEIAYEKKSAQHTLQYLCANKNIN